MSEPTASPMMIRLANVIYWGCAAIAGLLLALLGYLFFLSGVDYDQSDNVEIIFCAAVAYAFGRGVRYVIAGR